MVAVDLSCREGAKNGWDGQRPTAHRTDGTGDATHARRREHVESLLEQARSEIGNGGFAAQVHMDALAVEALVLARTRLTEAIDMLTKPSSF